MPKDTSKEETKRKAEHTIRYDILSSVDALFGKENSDFLRLFELEAVHPTSIKFFVREKFFGAPFVAKDIAGDITVKLQAAFPEYTVSHKPDNSGETITAIFGEVLKTEEDAEVLMRFINSAILLFIARNKS